MLGGGGGGQVHAVVAVGVVGEPFGATALDPVVKTLGLQLAIKQAVDAPVGGFLANEACRFCGEMFALVCRQLFQAVAHRINEILLADNKTHGQRVEESCAKGVAAVPAPREGSFKVH